MLPDADAAVAAAGGAAAAAAALTAHDVATAATAAASRGINPVASGSRGKRLQEGKPTENKCIQED